MAKIKLDDFSKELKTALDSAKKELLSPTSLQSMADDLAEQIKIRTRLGDGLDKDRGEPSKLRPLSKNYIETRKGSELSPMTAAKKSNLTFTGEMLDSIIAKISGSIVTITFSNQDSKDKARWNTEKGRPFMAISRVQIQRLTNSLNQKLSEILKKYLK